MLHMVLLGAACRHLLVLAVRMDCRLAAVGSRCLFEFVLGADVAGLFVVVIRLGGLGVGENIQRLVGEGRSLWMGSSSLVVEGIQLQERALRGSLASMVVLAGTAHRIHRVALPLDLPFH